MIRLLRTKFHIHKKTHISASTRSCYSVEYYNILPDEISNRSEKEACAYSRNNRLQLSEAYL